jgi:hypothetical protein
MSKIKIFISVLQFVTFLLMRHGTLKKCVYFRNSPKNKSNFFGVKMCSNLHGRGGGVTLCRGAECVEVNNICFVRLKQMEVIIDCQLRWEVVWCAVDRARARIYERCDCGGGDRSYPACSRSLDI